MPRNTYFINALIEESNDNPTGPFERFIYGKLKSIIITRDGGVVINCGKVLTVKILTGKGSYLLTDTTCRAVKGSGEKEFASKIQEIWKEYLREHFGSKYDDFYKNSSIETKIKKDDKVLKKSSQDKVFNIFKHYSNGEVLIGATETEVQAEIAAKELNKYAMKRPDIYLGATFAYRESSQGERFTSGEEFANQYNEELLKK